MSKGRWFASLILAFVVLVPTGTRAENKEVLRLDAVAMNVSGMRSGLTRLDIVFERWTTDEERQKLLDTLIEKDDDALMDAVDKIKPRVGYIRTSRSLGWDIQFARVHDLPGGGRRVIFVTDRPISFYENRNNTRSADYDFSVCEIHLGPNGEGEGKLAAATRVRFDKEKKVIELENYGIEPVRLTKVTVEK
ncbi:MAG: hypothetical protein ACHQNV_01405 [Vicinamibacteria bacterium]